MTGHRACNPAQPLTTVVIELGRLLERRLHGDVIGHEVTANQLMALIRIANSPGISRADLARGMQITPQAVGVLTGHLLEKGLISRTASRPGLPIELTLADAGYQILKASKPKLDDITREMLRFFRPNLSTALDAALRHLLIHLD